MNWDRIEGNWKQAKGKIKEQWGKLTDDHLDTIGGKRDQLSARFRNIMASRKMKPNARSTIGKRAPLTHIGTALPTPIDARA